MKTPGFYGKNTLSLLTTALLLSGIPAVQATLLDPAQSPLILTESVAPNLILTLDNSGSMFYAFVPDSSESLRTTRRVKSAYFNPMYYNPTITYITPVKFNDDGTRALDANQYTTSFTNAPNFGLNFTNTTGSVNLSNDYKVTWAVSTTTDRGTTYGNSFTASRLAENPAADFGAATISSTVTPGSATTSSYTGTSSGAGSNLNINGASVNISSTGSSSCTASINSSTNTPAPSVIDDGLLTTTTSVTTINTYSAVSCVKKSSGSPKYAVTATKTSSPVTTVTVARTDKTQQGVPAYYYLYDTSLTNCSSLNTDENCYRLVTVSSSSGIQRTADSAAGTDERANFARWYSFYRSRNLATLSAANLAFVGLPSTIRLTWQALANSCTTFDGAGSACRNNRLRKFSQQHRGNYFNWLPTITFAAGGTPLRPAMARAGEFLTTDIPWAAVPNPLTSNGGDGTTVQQPEYACRANYHILMTDGMWNGSDGLPTETLKPDHANNSLPDGNNYSQNRPFFDGTSNTLADLAFHYWATDASDLANDIKPIIIAPNTTASTQYWDPRNDPATWQHLTSYTIGLGLNAALTNAGIPWTGDTFGGAGYLALKDGTQNWPAATVSNDNNVYDLWHAAINSRGEFFSADSPDKIVAAFADIIDRISNRTTSAGAPGVTASIVQDTLTREVYETQLNSEDWSGNLTKYSVSTDGIRTPVWNAKAQIANQSAAGRTIKMFSTTTTSKLTDFTWDSLSPAQQALLNKDGDITNTPTDSKGSTRVSYIRGDQSAEGTAAGQFRPRSSVLGDIINSAPVIVGTPTYMAYLADAIDGGLNADGTSKYGAFKAAHRAEQLSVEISSPRRPMVYVGANDGMLHGFDANTGAEIFAFVPTAMLQNLYKLPAQKYKGSGHQFYVDGTPVIRDVYYDNAWHTVLIGTLRAGGRSLFALDITDPDSISLLWERSFDDTSPAADLANLGYTFPQPVIARLHTGKWAVVTGNGYGNQASTAADRASLMIFDVQTGAVEREILVTGDDTKANGLSSVKLADNDSDGIADYAYAGDLQGNMWRFDLVTTSSTPAQPNPFNRDVIGDNLNPNTFAVSYAGTPLFTAVDGRATEPTAQAIMAPPTLVRHPSSLGYLVIFGTGKYFERNDGTVDTTRAMSLYGIWDRKTKAQSTSTRTSPLTRTNLQTQTITEQATTNPFSTNAGVQGIRLLSQNTVQWYNSGASTTTDSDVYKWGWLLDFKVAGSSTFTGEMLINPMAARGQVLLLNTLTPNADPCKEGVDSWLYGLDPYTGGRTKFNVFDLDNSKTIDSGDTVQRGGVDTVVSSYKKQGSGGFTTNNGDIYTAPSQGGGMKYSSGPNSTGRQSWSVIPEEAQ